MITSTMGRMAEAEKLSVPQLQQAIKSGSLPAYIGIPLLQDKMKQMQQMKTAQQAQQPQQPPVADQIMQQAQAMAPGVDQLRSNLPTEGMAQGGIIAFEDGGQVQHYANRGLVKLTREQYDSLTPELQQTYINQYGAPPPPTTAGNQLNPLGLNTTPSPAVLAAMQGTPLQPQTQQVPAGVAGLPAVNVMTGAPVKNAQPTTDQLIQAYIDKLPAGPEMLGSKGTDVSTSRKITGTQGLPTLTKPDTITAPTIQDVTSEYMKPNAEPAITAEAAMARREKMLGPNTELDDVRKSLKEMKDKTTTQEDKAGWMALMKAGLSTMSGTSPYALANIGKGGEAGLEDYIGSQKQIQSAREKQLEVQNRLAQADRAEKQAAVDHGLHSEEADKAARETRRLHELDTKAHVATSQAALNFDAQKANAQDTLEYEKAKLSSALQLKQLDIARAQAGKASDYEDYINLSKKDPRYYTMVNGKPMFDAAKATSDFRGYSSKEDIASQGNYQKYLKENMLTAQAYPYTQYVQDMGGGNAFAGFSPITRK